MKLKSKKDKDKPVVTPLELVTTGINLMYATSRINKGARVD